MLFQRTKQTKKTMALQRWYEQYLKSSCCCESVHGNQARWGMSQFQGWGVCKMHATGEGGRDCCSCAQKKWLIKKDIKPSYWRWGYLLRDASETRGQVPGQGRCKALDRTGGFLLTVIKGFVQESSRRKKTSCWPSGNLRWCNPIRSSKNFN